MAQFYTSTNTEKNLYGQTRTTKFLVERAGDMAIPCGYGIKELPSD